eukprot:TRINITY_DN169407_c0_g1_i1.p1 TRINITY_DN169407_c0_g1~~TRINITY_DN169407_c0_g1_i1.p1  ORF type:complete len:180 (-),score=19.44 TRINITY_DN169407_c0_g1_i1:56-553(-)
MAKLELKEDSTWYIENHKDEKDWIVVKDAAMSQSVYINQCERCNVKIENKVKSLAIGSCKSVNVVVQDLLSSIEVTNGDKLHIQVIGVCPSISIDESSGIHILLSNASKGAEFLTSKSSEMTVSFQDEETEEMVELPITEQFVHRLEGKKIKSAVSDIYGYGRSR